MRIFKSYEGWSDLKILTNEDFHSSKSSGIYNFQTWIYHNFRETKNLFPEELVAKRDLKQFCNPRQGSMIDDEYFNQFSWLQEVCGLEENRKH